MARKRDGELRAYDTLKVGDKKKLQEQSSYPAVGGEGYSEYGWTPLTQQPMRDLSPLVQDRMQDIAFYLYDSNPIAHRIIEMTRDFVIGDGFSFKAKDKEVQKVLEDHWNDPSNSWEIKQDQKALEIGLYGEQFYPVFINPYNGKVKLGYIDPTKVQKVIVDKNNPEVLRWVVMKYNVQGEIKKFKVINAIETKGSKWNGFLDGEIFVFNINKVSFASRGRSDLLCLSDWIDGYDQFLFARLERANILNNYVWDVLLEDADEPTIKKWLENQSIPKPGSIRAHNQKVKWAAVAPNLESYDASKEAQLFKSQILGGAGFPNLWFGEGGETIRAGAVEMSLPTLKALKSRQKYVKYMITFIFKFVIDQAIMKGTLDKDVDKSFNIFAPPLTKPKEIQLGVAASRVTESIKVAQEQKWITEDQAKLAWSTFMKEVIGLDFGSIEEKVEEEKET